jgi:hypothetical protein
VYPGERNKAEVKLEQYCTIGLFRIFLVLLGQPGSLSLDCSCTTLKAIGIINQKLQKMLHENRRPKKPSNKETMEVQTMTTAAP